MQQHDRTMNIAAIGEFLQATISGQNSALNLQAAPMRVNTEPPIESPGNKTNNETIIVAPQENGTPPTSNR